MATALKDVKLGEFVLKGTTVDGSVEYVIGTDDVIRDTDNHIVAYVNCYGTWVWSGIADGADCAGYANFADCACYAGTADCAAYADCADFASFADCANFASFADCTNYADCANCANYAGNSTTLSGPDYCYGTSALWWVNDELYGYFASGSTTGPIRVSSVGSLPSGALVLYLQPDN